jgi:HSP20 family protein
LVRLHGTRGAASVASRALATRGGMIMAMRDLVPWNKGREVSTRRSEDGSPFFTLHREMNRLFDDVFRGFNLPSLGSDTFFDRSVGWPSVEVSETDKELKVTAELPGMDEKDVQVDLANGVLVISGEKKTETENDDNNRFFSERYYGRFERRIPAEDVEPDKVSASFKNGILTVKMPKLPEAQSKVKRSNRAQFR